MAYIVSVKNDFGHYCSFEVPALVYVYIRQLEAYIHHPEVSRLKEFYSDRFGGELLTNDGAEDRLRNTDKITLSEEL